MYMIAKSLVKLTNVKVWCRVRPKKSSFVQASMHQLVRCPLLFLFFNCCTILFGDLSDRRF